MPFEKDPNEIGALWLRSNDRGDYMTGEIGGVKVVCFPVKAKSDKAPTWRVLKSQPRSDERPVSSQRLDTREAPRRSSRVDDTETDVEY